MRQQDNDEIGHRETVVKMKLNAHLEHIVMPNVPLNAAQVLELCDRADEAQRMAAIDRARVKIPFLLPDEERAALRWARRL